MDYKIRWATCGDSKELGYVHANSWKVAYKDIISDKVLDEITLEKRKNVLKKQ
jgi:hypothetical protein